ncbi:MAG: DUF167 domain-containing protein [Actinomycetota bacterium]
MADAPLTATEDGVSIAVWVVAGSSRASIDGLHGERVKIRVTSPARQGRANDEVAGMLADALGAKVVLEAGMRSRSKTFHVFITDVDHVREKLGL